MILSYYLNNLMKHYGILYILNIVERRYLMYLYTLLVWSKLEFSNLHIAREVFVSSQDRLNQVSIIWDFSI